MDSVTIQQLPVFGGALTGLEPLEAVKDDVSVSITSGQIASIATGIADAALQAAKALKADLASPALTGTPTAPTATLGTNTAQLANTAFVQAAIVKAVTDLVNASPTALDTLKELADAIGDDPNFATTMLNALAQKVGVTQLAAATGASQVGAVLADGSIGTAQTALDALKASLAASATALALKAPLASPALTGTPTAPTAIAGDNTTQVATTAFVDAVRVVLQAAITAMQSQMDGGTY